VAADHRRGPHLAALVYFMHIFADPQDRETVWALNVQAWRSTDGGRMFQTVPTPFEDQHDLWLDPRDPQRNQPAFSRRSSSGEFRYIPDIVSTRHRWS